MEVGDFRLFHSLFAEKSLCFFVAVGCVAVAGFFIVKKWTVSATPREKRKLQKPSGKDHKMVLVVRTDLGMGKGKIAAQCCHAAVGAFKALSKREGGKEQLSEWDRCGQRKVVCRVSSEEELEKITWCSRSSSLCTYAVRDAGLTQVPSGSLTAVAIGPGDAATVDDVTGHLKLL